MGHLLVMGYLLVIVVDDYYIRHYAQASYWSTPPLASRRPTTYTSLPWKSPLISDIISAVPSCSRPVPHHWN